MKKKFSFLLIIIVLVVLAGCNETQSTSKENNEQNTKQSEGTINISLSTAATTGTYYAMGAAFSKVWNDNISDLRVSSQASEGSVQNLNLMAEGEVNTAFTSTGPLYNAYNGEEEFEGRPYKDVRVVAALYPNASHWLVRDGSGINSISDFKGKTFAAGAPGSVSRSESELILGAFEMDLDDAKVESVGFDDASNLMRNKRLDGLHYDTAVGTSGIVDLTATSGAKLISIDDEQLGTLIKENPMYFDYEIPAGTYDGQEEDIITMAQKGLLVAPESLPDEAVYELTKALWENIEDLRNTIPALEFATLEEATTGVADVPLHPGAEKFYKEEGIID